MRWAAFRFYGVLCATVLLARAVHAQGAAPETVPLAEAVEVLEGACISRAELLGGVEAWLNRKDVDRRIRIVVEERQAMQPRFVVRREGKPPTERRFSGGGIDCAELRAAVALAIALAIDATILQNVVEPPLLPTPPEPAPPEPTPPATEPTPAQSASAPRPAPRPAPKAAPKAPPPAGDDAAPVFVEASLLAGLGLVPEPTWGGAVAARLPAGPLAVRLGVMATAGTDVSVAQGTARVATLAAQLAGCLPLSEAGTFGACAGLAAGYWSARGRGFDTDLGTNLPWVAATAGPELTLPISEGAALLGRVEAFLPVVRPALEVRDLSGAIVEERSAPAAGMAASLGLRVRIQ